MSLFYYPPYFFPKTQQILRWQNESAFPDDLVLKTKLLTLQPEYLLPIVNEKSITDISFDYTFCQ
jgi:hypothetical protein